MRPGRAAARERADDGSAVVEFVSVVALLTLLFLAVVQVALVQHVRNTLVDCAGEGARFGGLVDRTPADAQARTASLIAMSLSPSYAEQVTASQISRDGVDLIEVRVVAQVPAFGLIPTPARLDVVGHGLVER
ncbi:MAG: TadE/TadG family type IV pilus assembly protein [Actinomycetales bacterium]